MKISKEEKQGLMAIVIVIVIIAAAVFAIKTSEDIAALKSQATSLETQAAEFKNDIMATLAAMDANIALVGQRATALEKRSATLEKRAWALEKAQKQVQSLAKIGNQKVNNIVDLLAKYVYAKEGKIEADIGNRIKKYSQTADQKVWDQVCQDLEKKLTTQ